MLASPALLPFDTWLTAGSVSAPRNTVLPMWLPDVLKLLPPGPLAELDLAASEAGLADAKPTTGAEVLLAEPPVLALPALLPFRLDELAGLAAAPVPTGTEVLRDCWLADELAPLAAELPFELLLAGAAEAVLAVGALVFLDELPVEALPAPLLPRLDELAGFAALFAATGTELLLEELLTELPEPLAAELLLALLVVGVENAEAVAGAPELPDELPVLALPAAALLAVLA